MHHKKYPVSSGQETTRVTYRTRIDLIRSSWQRRFLGANEKGFTLIELMATLVILALIIAIAVPAIGKLVTKANDQADESSISFMEDAGEMAHIDDWPFDTDVRNDEGELEEDSYKIPTLIQAGYLKLDPDSKFNKPENYVKKVNKSGKFIYMGKGKNPGDGPGDDTGNTPAPAPTDSNLFIWERLNGSDEFTGSGAFRVMGYLGTDPEISIPSTYQGAAVVEIGEYGFYWYEGRAENEYETNPEKNKVQLTSVYIPDSVTTIGDTAFAGNALTSVRIPASVTHIAGSAFMDNALTSVTIPGNDVVIDASAFLRNELTNVSFTGSVLTIGWAAFQENNLTTLVLPAGLESIGGAAFQFNQLTDVTIPTSVTRISGSAFNDNQLTQVFLHPGITSISDGAFANNNNLTILGVPGSEAERYTKNLSNQTKFVATDASGKPAPVDDAAKDYEFHEENGGIIITSYKGTAKNVVIPATIQGKPVTGILKGQAPTPFLGMGLESVEVPPTVTNIVAGAFMNNANTFILYGKDGTAAQRYANDMGLTFQRK